MTLKTAKHLTVFLAKTGIGIESLIGNTSDLKHFKFNITGANDVSLWIKPARRTLPKWALLFDGSIAEDILVRTEGGSAGAVLLLNVARRNFAVAFGSGRFLLHPEAFEDDFGFMVTLNAVDKNKIRSIDRKTVERVTRMAREQSSAAIPMEEFGLEIERDMLRSVSGQPRNTGLGERLTGTEALVVNAKIDLGDLPALLKLALKVYRSEGYKQDFPWVDNLKEIKRQLDRERLDQELVRQINSGDYAKVWLAPPETLEWDQLTEFGYGGGKKNLVPDIHLAEYLEYFRKSRLDLDKALHTHRVCCYYAASELPRHKWPIHKCINAELELDGKTWLLSGGKWYEVAANFVDEVNEVVSGIPETTVDLLRWTEASEAAYNEKLAKQEGGYLFDDHPIMHGGGKSRLEVCDVLTDRGVLIHVKRYAGSSVLSHLFAQGVVSADTIRNDSEFRNKVREKVPPRFREQFRSDPFDSRNFEIAFAIGSRSDKPLNLPFFSKVSLRAAWKRLTGMGYKVTCTKVQMT